MIAAIRDIAFMAVAGGAASWPGMAERADGHFRRYRHQYVGVAARLKSASGGNDFRLRP